MKCIMKKTLLIAVGIFSFNCMYSQSISPEVYSSSGGYYTGASATLSWTIGEPVIETVSNTNNIITQGFHQTNYEVTSVSDNPDLGFNISVFPNPVSNTLQISISSLVDNSTLKIELMDIMGKTLIKERLSTPPLGGTGGGFYQLNLSGYAPGSYFLRITTEKGELINSYKIQKAN